MPNEGPGVRTITREELEIENAFVYALIDKIPPKAYFDSDVLEYLEDEKYRLTEKVIQDIPRNQQAGMAIKGRQKRARLDPNQHKTVSQIQQEMQSEPKTPQKKRFKGTNDGHPRSHNIEILQEKLKNKIQAMQSNRNQKGIKKRTKNTKAAKRKAQKQRMEPKGIVKIKASPILTKAENSKPVFNKDGNIVFSKFDLADGVKGSAKKDSKKRLDKGHKALKKSLKKVEIEKEKLEKLKTDDPEKAKVVGDLKLWQKAVKKAEGVKIKDDPDKIKASLKKKEKKRMKSRKGWNERTAKLNQKMKEKQDKRQSNISKKKQERKDKKIKQLKKKGRNLPPGF